MRAKRDKDSEAKERLLEEDVEEPLYEPVDRYEIYANSLDKM